MKNAYKRIWFNNPRDEEATEEIKLKFLRY